MAVIDHPPANEGEPMDDTAAREAIAAQADRQIADGSAPPVRAPRDPHQLKCDPIPFADLLSGTKRVELRRDARRYQVGDLLRIREHDRVTGHETGAAVWAEVTHLQQGYGLEPGYVALSIDTTVSAPWRWWCNGSCHEEGRDDCRLCCHEPQRCCPGCRGLE